MKQGNMTVAEYEKEFSFLSKYAPELVLTEIFRCRQFEDGLNESIKKVPHDCYIIPSSELHQLVQATMKIKKSKMKNQERNWEKKFTKLRKRDFLLKECHS